MIRTWIGVALLAVSWLLGLDYYLPASPIAWAVVVVLGAVLLSGSMSRLPPRREIRIALVLLLPAVWYAAWPLRAAPLLIVVGLALHLLPIPRLWPKRLGQGAVVAGVVMLLQSLVMALYAAGTARSHELPRPLPEFLAGIARLLGIEATADGSNVVMHSIRQVHRLGATWDLLLDPATLCFFVGSLATFALVAWSRLPAGRRWPAWIEALRTLTLLLVVWLPIRAGVLMALYLHRVLRADDDLPLHVMNLFLSPWVHLLMLVGPVLLAWRFVRLPAVEPAETADQPEQVPADQHKPWPYPAAVGLILLAVAVFTAAVQWNPVGTRQQGRIMVVERHSTWEPTTKPYDTTWFGHDSGYNYAAVYDYCAQYFNMSRLLETDKIDARTLGQCDVLVIKVPTARYSPREVEAVLRFVEQGGGLLLIGDHTNVFDCGTYLNDVARPMGFTFRHDLLFGTGYSSDKQLLTPRVPLPYEQLYLAPRLSHPVIQHLPPMDLAVSCSIDPGGSRGRAVIQGTGLWSLPSEYHHDNYHPVPQHRPEMRYGAFVQLWSARYGKGRVLAFTDSTIFSNFCAFQPGKAELLRGMLDWLNHRSPGDPRPWLLVAGLLPLLAGLWLAGTRHVAWLLLLAAGACGWVIASLAVAAVGQSTMPVPVPEADRTLTHVVVDRTLSDVPLSNGAFIRGEGEGYGMFEQWIPRMGCYLTRESGPASFSGNALVVICPSRSVSREFRQRLVQYVREGGKLLLVDAPENTASTANSLLWPFGLSIHHDQLARGELIIDGQWPGIEIGREPERGRERACKVTGGRAIAHLGETPVGAVAHDKKGKGIVLAVGFGSIFNDTGMGYVGARAVWAMQPSANVLFTTDTYVRYNTQFALLRTLLGGEERVSEYFSGHVVFDRTVSEVTLPEPGTIPETDDGFGLCEMWPPYLGYSTARGSDAEAFSGDALVVIYPSRQVSDGFLSRLVKYVNEGGKLLVVDSPENTNSTANALLKPFKLSVDHDKVQQGKLVVTREKTLAPWPQIEIEPACRVDGGEPFAFLGESPVGTIARYKKGAVAVVGFGSLYDNASMRGSWDLPAPAKSLVSYDIQSAILRALLADLPFEKTMPSVGN